MQSASPETPLDMDAIYRAYQPKVARLVASRVSHAEDAKDIVSTVFLKVCAHLQAYDPAKASLSTWIYRIAQNQIIDYYRKRKELAWPEGYDPADTTPPSHADELLDHLADALEALPQRQRDAVILFYYMGLNHQQIAQRLGVSYANARKLCSLGVAALRKALLPHTARQSSDVVAISC